MARDMILSPSLLSSDFSRLADELKALETAGLQWAHLDVMDGDFVPNITFGPPVIKAMRKECSLFFDTHLMIQKPERYIESFAEAGCDLICFHAESTIHIDRVVHQIKDTGKKAAISLNPATPLENIRYLLPELDMVLIMSVNPGFGGQKFIPYSVDKIRELRAMIDKAGCDTMIEVDGGVYEGNIKELVDAGADVLVSGSAFFNSPPYKERHELFQTLAKG